MQWDDTKNSGFTTNDKPWNMINENYTEYNIKNQDGDENSILNHYRKVINIRKNNLALSLGSFQSINIKSKNQNLIACYIREYKDNKIFVLHNFSAKKESVELDITGSNLENKEITFTKLLGKYTKLDNKKNIIKITNVEPYSSIILSY